MGEVGCSGIKSDAPVFPTVFDTNCIEELYWVIIWVMMAKRFLGVPIQVLAVKKCHGPFYVRLNSHGIITPNE